MEVVCMYIFQYIIGPEKPTISPTIHRSIATESWSLKLCKMPPSECLNLIARMRKRMKDITKQDRVMYSAIARGENTCPAPYDGYSWNMLSMLNAHLPIVDSEREKENCS